MARARLRDQHKKILTEKLSSLKRQQGIGQVEESDFDRRVRERIRREEQQYAERQRSLKVRRLQQLISTAEILSSFLQLFYEVISIL